MLFSDIKRVIEQVSRDKGIPMESLIHTLEEALESAAKKKLGSHIDVEAQYNPDAGEIEVFQFREVVEEVTNPDFQLSLKDGRKLDPDCEIGDSLGTKLDTTSFGRIAAQSAKQVIIQKVKDAERNAVYDGFIDRKGEIINGIVQRVDRGDIVVNLGQTEALLPAREQIPRETYRRGDRIRASIMKVLQDSRGPQIILSRTHPQFLIALFRSEVPEVAEGVVNIETASREPGVRAKIAVSSQDSGVDPVGACVGMKGSRVQAVVQELRGEKIDIIPWSPDAARFVCNALAPAEILRVVIDEDNRAMEVIVPDEFLSIAIGKKGQNVRLASRLTGWHLDVKSEASYSQAMKEGYAALMGIPGIGMTLAEALYAEGFTTLQDVADAVVEDLLQVEGVDEDMALNMIQAALQTVASEKNKDRQQAETDTEFAPEAETGSDHKDDSETTLIDENRQVPADEAATPESENE
ncbi:NusA antitermination factor [Desulfobotulus alkaliphilus]|uniref:Transcription termination/antitermination protein NusA n=1 Tax=Desulfobotulus alkaliphilus TaxID=622671 RepID=A0A562RAG2_9BACT|nr:transcription termination factor NusA [Desulfobotulus alkaliphilus]TWI66042.1 NusA antitermination factor [Desulfobotulus alkaliphilus]